MEQEVVVSVLLCSQLLLSSVTLQECHKRPVCVPVRMAATVGSSWLLAPGAIATFIILLLLFILLTSLCSDCRRRSLEVQDSEVKLEEHKGGPQENPGTSEIQRDEENPISFTPWRSHLGAPNTNQDVKTAIPSSADQRTGDRNSHEGRLKKAGLATPSTGQVKRNPEVSSRLESHPRQVD